MNNNYKWLNKIKEERGATAVITAILLVCLLIATALVIDFGITYIRTAELQNAMDSASLAAASTLPIESGNTARVQEAKQKAIDYAAKNHIEGLKYEDIELNLGENNLYSSISISQSRKVDLHFAPVIGIKHIDVNRSATAGVKPIIRIKNAVPLSITQEYLSEAKSSGQTQHLDLKVGASNDDVYQGAFGVLDLDGGGGGASDYKDWLENGFPDSISVGEQLDIEPGNMSGDTMKAFQDRYDLCTHAGGCTIDHYVEGCPRIVIVPVITYDNAHQVTVQGFSAFIIEECQGQGVDSIITGSFLKDLLVQSIGSINNNAGNIDFGVYAITLIE